MIVSRVPGPWIFAVPALLAAGIYARFFGGFWLSDDFGFLHRMWLASAGDELWTQTWAQFFGVDPDGVVFYRPMTIASVALNEWSAGNSFAGWYALNFAAHLANTVMVALLIVRLAAACDRDGRIAAIIASAFFALCPAIAEGVFWVAARADAFVTLFTLAGMVAWSSSSTSPVRAALLPVFLVLALGFKESAAVFPLQMTLVALAWPRRLSRAQILAVVACLALIALFFALRAHFFGDFWRVYTRGGKVPQLDELWLSAASFAGWWKGLTRNTPGSATAYLAIVACSGVLVAAASRAAQRRLAAAILCAFAGLVVATLLSTGPMAETGEGGRLGYTPIAWLALAVGVAAARPVHETRPDDGRGRYRRAALGFLLCATVAGTWVLQDELRTARTAQNLVRDVVHAMPEWASSHPGLTLLLLDENYGPVVMTRNAQGWLALPPVQSTPLLHRVLPTLPKELDARYEQLSAGLASRLDRIRPSRLDAAELGGLFEKDAVRWPAHYACWSAQAGRIVEISAPDRGDRAQWTEALRSALGRCAIDAG